MVKRVAVALVAVAVLIGALVLQRSDPAAEAAATPLTRQADGSLVLAKAGVTEPVLDLYEDFDCPVCRDLHAKVNVTLLKMASEGRIKLVFHPATIFTDEPMRSNSIRAAAAARCVPVESWLAYREQLYGMQPAPHGTASGFTVDELVAAGKTAGVQSPGFDSCVRSQERAEGHLKDNPTLEGTPTVLLNGQALGNLAFDPQALEQLVTQLNGPYLES
ncbi:thioredoxin domain-containing protein [Nonomuraea sp. NPDC050310]|uniref:DsbA family protein n=1 Tax=unclassified Nonomuraea TaxID=2593643 RepID=UPI0033F908A8